MTRRVVLLALSAMVAGAALLSPAGGAYAHGAADQALAVAVDGPGTVTGTGIACRDGAGDCVELYAEGTQVTLTASSDSGAAFTGWGGDCSAATGTTCTLTMSSAKAVTATFTSSGEGGNPTLTVRVSVSGAGKVTGQGIDCGNGATDCSESYTARTVVTLTETAGTGATFSGWGGACSGTGRVCNLVMDSPKAVSASFSTPTPGPRRSNTFALRSLGRPIVVRTSAGWAVTVRFHTSRSAAALLRLLLSGRDVSAFSFKSPAGGVLVGPFEVARAGAYRFQLTLSDARGAVAELSWNLCLPSGSCR